MIELGGDATRRPTASLASARFLGRPALKGAGLGRNDANKKDTRYVRDAYPGALHAAPANSCKKSFQNAFHRRTAFAPDSFS